MSVYIRTNGLDEVTLIFSDAVETPETGDILVSSDASPVNIPDFYYNTGTSIYKYKYDPTFIFGSGVDLTPYTTATLPDSYSYTDPTYGERKIYYKVIVEKDVTSATPTLGTYNHYIQVNGSNEVIATFSDAYQTAVTGDILVKENSTQRDFIIPDLLDSEAFYSQYRYVYRPTWLSEQMGVVLADVTDVYEWDSRTIYYTVIVERDQAEKDLTFDLTSYKKSKLKALYDYCLTFMFCAGHPVGPDLFDLSALYAQYLDYVNESGRLKAEMDTFYTDLITAFEVAWPNMPEWK